jgi:Ferritin-like domain
MPAMGEPRWPLACIALVVVLAGGSIAGCGGGGDGAAADERDSDAEIVNVSIGQELTLIQAYTRSMPFLERGEAREIARLFRAHEHEHVNGLTRALRGLGRDFEAESTEVDFSEVRDERDALLLLYGMTNAQLTSYLEDVPHLSTPAPQSFAASIAASQAQHLVALRGLLGAEGAAAVPEAFDTGEVPPPGEADDEGEG